MSVVGTGECLQEFAAHKGGVNALAAVAARQQQQPLLLLSAGKDHLLKFWSLTTHQQQQQQHNGIISHKGSAGSIISSVQCVAEYRGHKEAVQTVAVSPAAGSSSSLCCSGGWDGQLLLWRTGGGPRGREG